MATSAKQWKNKVSTEATDLELPSGNVALVRQISPQAFITSGLIPDPLSEIIQKSIHTKRGLPPSALQNISSDPKQLTAAMELFDRVLCHVVVEPHVDMPPQCRICEKADIDDRHVHAGHKDFHVYDEAERDDEVLYSDQVDMDDKMFIFNWCLGGTRNLERFREELQSNVESISDSKNIRPASKRSGVRK